MYQIGEFSKIVGITVKALRYYDEIGLLQPAQINEENGYRYYDNISYQKAMWIQSLKRFDFSVKEMQEVIANVRSDDDLADYLLEKQAHISSQISSMKKMQKQIDKEITFLKEVKNMSNQQVPEIIEVKDMLVASIRYKGRYEQVGEYLGKIFKVVGGKALSAPFSLYYDESFKEENADVEVCVEVKNPINKGDVSTKTLKGGKFVSILHIGSYETLSSSYKAISDYITKNKLNSKTPSREIYLKGPGMLFKGNPGKYETQILIEITD